MKTKILLSIAFLFSISCCTAQNANNYWYFGNQIGLYFDSTGAHPNTGEVSAGEGAASISDGCGLLFYTDGNTVYNKNHEIMARDTDIGGECTNHSSTSSTQAALIVRQPGSTFRFYIFTTDCIEDGLGSGLRYSIVNMDRENGLGEVTQKNKPLLANSEEKLTACKHANGCDVWIISHEYGTNNFYSYLLTSSGLDENPVISSTGQVHSAFNSLNYNARGYLKASPNGEKLINVNPDGAYAWADTLLPELFDFDKQTGVVSSDFVFPIDTTYWWPTYYSWTIPFYGATFSPDNSKLYLSSGWYGPNLQQYDLNAGTQADIINSKTLLINPYPFESGSLRIGALVNAPDGKIYTCPGSRNFLGVINFPNSAGVACNYVDSVITYSTASSTVHGGLPNFFEDYINPIDLVLDFDFSQTYDTIHFMNNTIGAIEYIWEFGDGAVSYLQNPYHVYQDTGYYTVTLIAKDSLCNVDKNCQTLHVSEEGAVVTGSPNGLSSPVLVYPNPFNDVLTVEYPGAENFEIELMNPIGQRIFFKKFNNTDKAIINLDSDIGKGIYLIRITKNGETKIKKLTKLH